MLEEIRPKRTAVSAAVAVALIGTTTVQAQEQGSRIIEEITVTATKVEESLQDVPIAVSALSGDAIEELGISNFSDYVLQLPSVTAGGSGPGQNTIYIRGVASTTPNLTTAGVAGLAPNVAFYLDEQPLAQPGRNLDVYAADLQRIEVLSGPQGTLFGSSSQAGNVRLITNKPDFDEFHGSIRAGANTITDGGESGSLEVMLNVPITESFAVRGVLYTDTQGGWIDNVAGTRDASQSARFRPEGTVRDNGVPVSADRAGFQAGDDLSGVTFLDADNSALVKEDINETTYTGGRFSARWDVTDRLRLDLQHTQQDLDADGVFFADPSLGDLKVERFANDKIEDTFGNTAWTASLMFGELELLYTGAYTDRETDQVVDYTDYLFVGQYLPYYICDTTVSYPQYQNPVLPAPAGTCQAPNLFVDSRTKLESITHEFRITTDQSAPLRVTAGAFYQDLELKELNDFTYPGSVAAISGTGQAGFPDNYPLTNISAPPGEVNSAGAGYFSDPGPFPTDAIFRNDILRTDEQFGVFGELTYDFNEKFSVTVGGRWYDIEVDLEGSANSSFFNFGLFDTYEDNQRGGTNISAKYGAGNPDGNPDKASTDGTIFKVTGTWRPNADQMYYATISEGFRAGLLNRPGGSANPAGTFTVPFALDTDDITNFEIGMKSTFADGTFQLNGALFFVDVENLQTTIFDPSITNLFFSDNAANAEVTGLEADFVWLPAFSDRLTVTGAISILDSEITEVLTPTNDVRAGDELAFAPGFQGTINGRYEWDFGSSRMVAHIMAGVNWSSESYSDVIIINRDRIDSWTMLNLSGGLSTETWNAEIYIQNLTDERAEVARNFVFDRTSVTYARPLTVGVRAGFYF
jgi:outer membrane receptor protein involved in Fe transport